MNLWNSLSKLIAKEFREHPLDFLRQPTITRCLHPIQHGLRLRYLDRIEDKSILERIADPPTGNPRVEEPYACSLSTVQHAYYIQEIGDRFGASPTDLHQIVEIGGGYGNGARILRALGFSGGYTIVDLPELHEIQQQYAADQGIEFSSLGDTEEIANVLASISKTLLLGAFSISEMPFRERQLLEPYYKDFEYVFVVHNEVFNDIDNIKYFAELGEGLVATHEVQHGPDKVYKWIFSARRRQ